MAQSKKDPKRKQKQLNYKNSKKQKTMDNNQQQLPEVKNSPVWKGDDVIEMNGAEFEHIYNYISNVNNAYMAIQSIMNKNIINGTIKMQYEKLNPDTGQYDTLTGEDAKPYEEEFEAMVNAVKNQSLTPPATQQEEKVERLDAIVNENGVPYAEEDRGKPNLTIA